MVAASGTTGSKAMGRLAPSPTGVLHLGNARTFLLAWLSVRARGGTLLLRVEDIDGPRVKAGAVEQTVAGEVAARTQTSLGRQRSVGEGDAL